MGRAPETSSKQRRKIALEKNCTGAISVKKPDTPWKECRANDLVFSYLERVASLKREGIVKAIVTADA